MKQVIRILMQGHRDLVRKRRTLAIKRRVLMQRHRTRTLMKRIQEIRRSVLMPRCRMPDTGLRYKQADI